MKSIAKTTALCAFASAVTLDHEANVAFRSAITARVRNPRPRPTVAPRPAPVAAPKPAPRPAPRPAPVAAPKPAPMPAPVAAPRPAPVAAPKPAPVAAPVAAPVMQRPAPTVAPVMQRPAPTVAPVMQRPAPVAAPMPAPVAAPMPAPEPVAMMTEMKAKTQPVQLKRNRSSHHQRPTAQWSPVTTVKPGNAFAKYTGRPAHVSHSYKKPAYAVAKSCSYGSCSDGDCGCGSNSQYVAPIVRYSRPSYAYQAPVYYTRTAQWSPITTVTPGQAFAKFTNRSARTYAY